jgi:putative tryptophan/tyrosine transport system substrate-binding protein
MRRREFITLLGGAAVLGPRAARAQQSKTPESKTPVIGFLHGGTPTAFQQQATAFRDGLRSAGYVEGQNLAVVYRWAEGHFERLPALADELVQRRVSVIAAFGSDIVAHAATKATSVIPVVFLVGQDVIKSGLVASLNRPGGNATGVTMFVPILVPKQMELARTLVPNAAVIAVLRNPGNPNVYPDPPDLEKAAQANGMGLLLVNASTEKEIEAAFATMTERHAGALLVPGDVFFTGRREQIVTLAAQHAIPAIYGFREYVDAGGLVSYGNNLNENARLVGNYVARVLGGEKPGNLPVQQPTKFEFVINLATAKTLGLTISANMQLLADEVIE